VTESGPEKPQTWLPLVIALAAAVVVIVALLVMHALRADLAPARQAAADACEVAYTREFPNGPGITAGEVYAATEWRDVTDTLVGLGYLTDDQAKAVTGEQAAVRDDEAAALAVAGLDRMTVVWQLDDQTHAYCLVTTQGDDAVLPVTTVGPLTSDTELT
jgi:hypothetical protein